MLTWPSHISRNALEQITGSDMDFIQT